MKSTRNEDRELCADLVKVQWENEAGSPRNEWAILGDISPSGACLEMDEPIPSDTLVSLQFPKDNCRARVRYCTFDKVNYLVGVQFEQGYRWSRRRFKPDHLLQFRLSKVSGR
ncbi:MAG TPA: PilZ domain-containing protein [Acidobacteriota bacterium]|nr:PilZ domain-containing protein [Acidobacteriota bacterium]